MQLVSVPLNKPLVYHMKVFDVDIYVKSRVWILNVSMLLSGTKQLFMKVSFSVQDVFTFEWALLDTHIQCNAAIWHVDSANKGRVYITLFCVNVCVCLCQVSAPNKCVFNKGSFSAGEAFKILESCSSAVCVHLLGMGKSACFIKYKLYQC